MTSAVANRLLQSTKVGHVLEVIDRNIAAVAADAITINQIPAPTFDEGERAEFIEERFASMGLEVTRNGKHDVIARVPGAIEGPALLLQAGLDTVFPPSVNPTARVEGKKVVGPGIGDNAVGLASLLALAETVSLASLGTLGPIVLAATAGTNRTGNVAGVRRLLDTHGGEIGWALCLQGHGLGRLAHTAVRTRRYHLQWHTDDGSAHPHEFLPDLLAGLGGLGGGSAVDLEPLEEVLTTGREATDGIGLDLKLSSTEKIRAADRRIRDLVRSVAEARDLPLKIVRVGDWDAATLVNEHPLVRAVEEVHATLRIGTFAEPMGPEAAVILGAGIPCVALGITHGRNRHLESEWVELDPIAQGLSQVFLTALALYAEEG